MPQLMEFGRHPNYQLRPRRAATGLSVLLPRLLIYHINKFS